MSLCLTTQNRESLKKSQVSNSVYCNSCGKEFDIKKVAIEKQDITLEEYGVCSMEYFKCPHCNKVYPVFILAHEDERGYNELLKLQSWLLRYQERTKSGTDNKLIKKWKNKHKRYLRLRRRLFEKHKTLSKTYEDVKQH